MAGHAGAAEVGQQEPAKITLKLATMAPKGHVLSKHAEAFIKQIRQATNNEVNARVYWGGIQGDDANVLRKIRFGQLHGGFFIGAGLGLIVSDVRVTEIPYVFNLDSEVAYVRDKLSDQMNVLFEENGFVVLAWTNVGFVYNFSKIPIRSVETLRQQRCWVDVNDPLAKAVYRAMGITPVQLAMGDVLTAVSANLIDTAPNTPFGALAFRYYTKFNYMSDFPVANIVGADVISKKIWDQISPTSQKIIKRLVVDYNEKRNEELIKTNAKSIELLKKAGIEIVHVEPSQRPDDVAFLKKTGKRVRESQVGILYSRELLDQTLALLEEFRRKNNINIKYSFIE
jgi:TRAP-type C4-dicarboxylate transport system substrate-binding protein